jgi:hypothetical protein
MESGDDELEHQANVCDADLLSEHSDHLADKFSSTSYESMHATGSCLFNQKSQSDRLLGDLQAEQVIQLVFNNRPEELT